jgi:hypothetical protein
MPTTGAVHPSNGYQDLGRTTEARAPPARTPSIVSRAVSSGSLTKTIKKVRRNLRAINSHSQRNRGLRRLHSRSSAGRWLSPNVKSVASLDSRVHQFSLFTYVTRIRLSDRSEVAVGCSARTWRYGGARGRSIQHLRKAGGSKSLRLIQLTFCRASRTSSPAIRLWTLNALFCSELNSGELREPESEGTTGEPQPCG